MKKEMQIIIEVTRQAENFYEDAVRIGDHAAYVMRERYRSQLTGLETIAESALKASDILDYIKRQIARYPHWRQKYPVDETSDLGFGERLKRYLERDLVERRETMCSKERLNIGETTDEERTLRRRIYLLLIRQFLRQVVVQYEYRVYLENTGKET